MMLDLTSELFRRVAAWIVLILLSSAVPAAAAQLRITAAPVLRPATDAPLARVLELSTNVRSRVTVMASDGQETWQRQFEQLATSHTLPLLGFKPGRAYTVHLTLHDATGQTLAVPGSLSVVTAPLPADFPPIEIRTSHPDLMEPGYTLLGIRARLKALLRYIVILDSAGDVVWY